jgi:uncharacterized membrane protein
MIKRGVYNEAFVIANGSLVVGWAVVIGVNFFYYVALYCGWF